eukprot:TRINITY_DN29282_c0_g1_i1.p1 TRINITY_DN29282_c0_g1~~TRINITY_DN29282_c0_g1_i1.p1  ORF type:complete len:981 (+),score=191.95 TRINITY_DN29282_c0_g1_i1:254-2944(+)
MLEVGSVREAHRMTVLAKNIMDSVVSLIAFSFAAGTFCLSLVVNEEGHVMYERQLSHWAFCATSVTICSGAMAERTHILAYLLHATVMAAFIYAPLADATWGRGTGFLHPHMQLLLHEGVTYHDCAGSGVVHLTGGLAALAGNLLLGRRIMKPSTSLDTSAFLKSEYDDSSGDGNSDGDQPREQPEEKMPAAITAAADPECPPEVAFAREGEWPRRFDDEARDALEFKACNYLQAMGMFMLWVGWYGFNTGSALTSNSASAWGAGLVAWNTTMAASAGGLGACIYLYGFHHNLDAGFLCNGVLSGLVSCTASCDVASPLASAVIGLVSGMLVYPSCSKLVRWARLDDPVDAVPVHAASGLFGVLATAFCKPDCPTLLDEVGMLSAAQASFCADNHSLGVQLAVQTWGALVIFLWTFSISLSFWSLFAICERVQATELVYIQELQEILAKWSGDADAEKAGLNEVAASVVKLSRKAQRILSHHGWRGSEFEEGSPKDIHNLQAELQAVRLGHLQTSLEPQTTCFMQKLVRVIYSCRFMRDAACCVRMRIHPAAELSGLGTAKVDGGKVFRTLRRAAHQIAELRQDQRSVHSPLKREVKELTMIVQSQDILLGTLARNKSVRRANQARLQSVPEESRRGSPATSPQISSTPESFLSRAQAPNAADGSQRRPQEEQAPNNLSATVAVQEVAPSAPAVTPPTEGGLFLHAQALRSLGDDSRRFQLMLPSDTESTISDQSMGCLSPGHSVAGSTPPPTVYGRNLVPSLPRTPASQSSALPMPDVTLMANHLATILHSQQQLLATLASANPGGGQLQQAYTPNQLPDSFRSYTPSNQPSQAQPFTSQQQQMLISALQTFNSGGVADTPRSMGLRSSRSSNFSATTGSRSGMATPVDDRGQCA